MISALFANFDAQVHGVRVLVINRRNYLGVGSSSGMMSDSVLFARRKSKSLKLGVAAWRRCDDVGHPTVIEHSMERRTWRVEVEHVGP